MKLLLTENEMQILDIFWTKKQWLSGAKVWEHLNANGKNWERSTVNTYLTRMAEKGYLIKEGTKYQYALSKLEFKKKKAQKLLNSFFNGSVTEMLVALTGGEKISDEEARGLQRFLEEQERMGK